MSFSTDNRARRATWLAAWFAAVSTYAAEDPARLAEQAREAARQIQLDITPAGNIDQERVARIAAAGIERGREQFERQAAERRARTDVQVMISEEGLQVKAPATGSAEAPPPTLAGRLVVAISTSMPMEQVRAYARQLDGVPEGILVLRGFVGGAHSVKPTVEWIERALRKQPDDEMGGHYRVEVVVDPLAFRMLGITKVPAITFLPGVQDLRHCDAEQLLAARLAYGAVSVRGALNALRPAISVPPRLEEQLGGSR